MSGRLSTESQAQRSILHILTIYDRILSLNAIHGCFHRASYDPLETVMHDFLMNILGHILACFESCFRHM